MKKWKSCYFKKEKMINVKNGKIETNDLENLDIYIKAGKKFFKTREEIIKLFNLISPYSIWCIRIGFVEYFKNPPDNYYEKVFYFPTEENSKSMIILFDSFLKNTKISNSYVSFFIAKFNDKRIKRFSCIISKKEKDD